MGLHPSSSSASRPSSSHEKGGGAQNMRRACYLSPHPRPQSRPSPRHACIARLSRGGLLYTCKILSWYAPKHPSMQYGAGGHHAEHRFCSGAASVLFILHVPAACTLCAPNKGTLAQIHCCTAAVANCCGLTDMAALQGPNSCQMSISVSCSTGRLAL